MKKGEKMSEEQKNKISKRLQGHFVSEETRIKIGKSSKGRHPVMEFKKGHPKLENAYSFPKGERHPCWMGGKKKVKGYWYTHKPNHPFAIKSRYVKQSRLAMEQGISRFLEPSEVIHHKNGITDDDRIENLRLFKNQSEHQKFHMMQKYEKRN